MTPLHAPFPEIRVTVRPTPSLLAAVPALALALLAACGGDRRPAAEPPAAAADAAPLSFDGGGRIVTRTSGSCDDPAAACADATLSWSVATGGDDETRSAVMREIETLVAAGARGALADSGAGTPDELADRFIREYEAFRASPAAAGSAPRWILGVSVRAAQLTPALVGVEAVTESFTGGAHGIRRLDLRMLRVPGGTRMTVADLVTDTTAFLALAERMFRRARDLRPTESLSARGFEFPGNRFVLPANVGVRETGVVLHYNPYEIGPYALGATDVLIPTDSLKGLIREELLGGKP